MVEEPVEDRARPVFDMGKFTRIQMLGLNCDQKLKSKEGKMHRKSDKLGKSDKMKKRYPIYGRLKANKV